jgi:NADH pyrophosphatase NudC (nudix superfamily)
MTQEALKLALEALDNLLYWDNGKPEYDEAREAITAIKEALRENAMREVQRLGQEIEQEPVGTVKELFTQAAWEKFDVRGSTKVYLDTPPQLEERNFCPRCGKRTKDIHTCTSPQDNT